MIPAAVDLDLLRAFVAACRIGNLSRAAEATGRTQSAMSMQMRRLEGLLGKKLLRRTGRGVLPTAEGEVFLGYASRILTLGDEAAARLRQIPLAGTVTIGLPEEVALASLPSALGQFHRIHPDVSLDIIVDNTAAIGPLWQQGRLDIMIANPSGVPDDAVASWSVELQWVCGLDHAPDTARPLDLVVFPEPCTWRRRMFEILAEAGVDHRIAFTSPSVAAVQAAVENGLGIALLTPECIRVPLMRVLPRSQTMPPPVIVQYGLYARATRTPAVDEAIRALMSGLR
ncbi:DNA-binding transcriptional regulator, LysR family [Enhydrobacter aerosaccus]|uniref:DNA-binding transcriptional regulator, LysR family n=1 Tax=Enhydrobacter aerosaccus TaxID=225324 RepID=A0A1T4T2L7_9HYPH|nr:LysR substrate-binding domain-containing protein [Enhydrobacter aerosaccus]SKA34725.1 DNA-binding transcriptional regulator, LysR family [Enhydrobacter aerosaccus]